MGQLLKKDDKEADRLVLAIIQLSLVETTIPMIEGWLRVHGWGHYSIFDVRDAVYRLIESGLVELTEKLHIKPKEI